MTASDQPVTERPAWYLPGVPMAFLGSAALVGGTGLIVVTTRQAGGVAFIVGLLAALFLLAGVLLLRGLTPVSPGHARVVQLFGRYCGTIRDTGLKWVNPFAE